MIVVELTVACAGKFVTMMTEPAGFAVHVVFSRRFGLDVNVAFDSGSGCRAIAKARRLKNVARMWKRELLHAMLINVVPMERELYCIVVANNELIWSFEALKPWSELFCANECEATSQLTWTLIKSTTVKRDTQRPKTGE
jgi:hypothetical protein